MYKGYSSMETGSMTHQTKLSQPRNTSNFGSHIRVTTEIVTSSFQPRYEKPTAPNTGLRFWGVGANKTRIIIDPLLKGIIMSETFRNCKVFTLNKGFVELLKDLKFPVENLNEGTHLIMDSDGCCQVVEGLDIHYTVLPKHRMVYTQVYDIDTIIVTDGLMKKSV